MYDFELQVFQDVNGKRVYPIIYGGTTYLPIRAISGLMGASIEWNSSTQTISIHRDVPTPVEERSAATVAMTDLFNQAVELYNQSTAKISVLQSTQDSLQLQAMADGVSIDYEVAKANTALGKEIK
ncbi:MAG: stalk domain-containing protein, partial [Bacteroidales bacterium]